MSTDKPDAGEPVEPTAADLFSRHFTSGPANTGPEACLLSYREGRAFERAARERKRGDPPTNPYSFVKQSGVDWANGFRRAVEWCESGDSDEMAELRAALAEVRETLEAARHGQQKLADERDTEKARADKWAEDYAQMEQSALGVCEERNGAQAELANAKARADRAEAAITELHQMTGRGDGHGSVSDTLACIVDRICTRETDMGELDRELTQAEARIAELEALSRQVRDLDDQAEQDQEEKDALLAKLRVFEGQIEALGDNNLLQIENEKLRAELDRERDVSAGRSQLIGTLTRERDIAIQQVADGNDSYRVMAESRDTEKARADRLYTTGKQYEAQLAEKDADLTLAKARIAELEAKLRVAVSDCDHVCRERDALTKELAEAERLLGQALKRIEEQQASLKSKLFNMPLLDRVVQLEKELAEAQKRIAELEANAAAADFALRVGVARVTELEGQAEGYRTAWADACKERERAKDSGEALTRELAEAREELEGVRHSLTGVEKNDDWSEDSLGEIAEDLVKRLNLAKELGRRHRRASRAFEVREKHAAKLQAELSEAKREIDRLRVIWVDRDQELAEAREERAHNRAEWVATTEAAQAASERYLSERDEAREELRLGQKLAQLVLDNLRPDYSWGKAGLSLARQVKGSDPRAKPSPQSTSVALVIKCQCGNYLEDGGCCQACGDEYLAHWGDDSESRVNLPECDGPDCNYPNGCLKCNPEQDHLPRPLQAAAEKAGA